MLARLAQSVERKTLNLVVVGSSPTMGVSFHRRCVGTFCATQTQPLSNNNFDFVCSNATALLAQWLERAAVNCKVTGSIPVGSEETTGSSGKRSIR